MRARVHVPGGLCPWSSSGLGWGTPPCRSLPGCNWGGRFLNSPYQWPQPWQQDFVSTNLPSFLDLFLQIFLPPLFAEEPEPTFPDPTRRRHVSSFPRLSLHLGPMPHFFRSPKPLCPPICPLPSLWPHWLPFTFPISISFSVSKACDQTLSCSSGSLISMASQSSLNSRGPA